MTFMAGIVFNAQTGESMRNMPILRTFGRCFLLFIVLFVFMIVTNRLF
jgi:hypothetical protein